MKETTVSHLNESRQNIVVDGKLSRCNKVRVIGKKNNVVYMKYLQCGMALNKADGSKWKPYNKVKATSSSKKIRCAIGHWAYQAKEEEQINVVLVVTKN